jgi:hypothetical protein
MHFVDSTEFSDISLEPALLTGSYTRVSKKVVDDTKSALKAKNCSDCQNKKKKQTTTNIVASRRLCGSIIICCYCYCPGHDRVKEVEAVAICQCALTPSSYCILDVSNVRPLR